MHVDGIAVGRITKNAFVTGEAWVTIVDAAGSPVAGATVSGAFNAIRTSTMSAATGSDGVAYFTTGKAKATVADFCFEVGDVVLGGYAYDSAANVETRACESGTVFGAGGRGMLAADDTPTSFFLGQNYPNPFNPVTTIRFGLPNAVNVRLDIFDVTGRRVATLVDGPMGAGIHDIEWNARRAASGIYFYRIKAGAITRTEKMILLR
ncbi:MAG: T9SS type A sorting domain-containing protein [Candidatus Krumholzibacteriota bacterium]|nr:T9SS type A sorting domain-containing protein [Candidatus Krumholzibacteriota bacterium]